MINFLRISFIFKETKIELSYSVNQVSYSKSFVSKIAHNRTFTFLLSEFPKEIA
jgi:hypothetical protein